MRNYEKIEFKTYGPAIYRDFKKYNGYRKYKGGDTKVLKIEIIIAMVVALACLL